MEQDIEARIAADFNKAEAGHVRAALERKAARLANFPESSELPRIFRCMLFLADGNLNRLLKMVEVDWRDLIVAAEYGPNDKRIRNFSEPIRLDERWAPIPSFFDGRPRPSAGKRKFNIRILLIITMLVAVVLGLIVWLH